MPLFSIGKDRPEKKKPVIKREVISLVCPECRHEQSESKIALSTYCRGCGSHYKIEGGKAVCQPKTPNNPFDPDSRAKAKAANDQAGAAESREEDRAAAETLVNDEKPVQLILTPIGHSEKNIPTRRVSCLECSESHDAPAEASSTLCPACGTYISLKDYVIDGLWNQQIKTRGNVTIQKKASVTGATVLCHNIHIHGSLNGGVACSGDCTLGNHGKVIGKIRCKRLIVEKRSNVAFADEVECESALIDGSVTGHFICSGKLHLKKKATLNGNVEVGTMVIDKGARHNGRVSILS